LSTNPQLLLDRIPFN
jgi:hypothetical protein